MSVTSPIKKKFFEIQRTFVLIEEVIEIYRSLKGVAARSFATFNFDVAPRLILCPA